MKVGWSEEEVGSNLKAYRHLRERFGDSVHPSLEEIVS